MNLGLQGKTALVFGAGGGLGGAIARSLAREGAKVALADINAESLVQAAQDITEHGGKVCKLPWDLADL